MIEVYVGTADDAQLRIYAGGGRVNSASPVTASLYDMDGVLLRAEIADIIATADSGETHEYYSFPLTLAETGMEDQFVIKWEYQPAVGVDASRTDAISVVTPYVWPDQVRTEFPVLANRSFAELKHLERVVRYTINAFCGQSFGLERNKTYIVNGSGGRSLWLPKRLLRLNNVSYGNALLSPFLTLQDEGRSLAFPGYSGVYRDIKADIGLGYGPYNYFLSSHNYAVVGDWGWDHVPGEIEQAASILVGRFQEPEQTWRRYNVDNIRANDWRMEFTRGSLETTGDVDVDIMLSKYKVAAYGVI